jgi:hypothetical protein
MKVVEFPVTNLNDLALQLRKMADWIEKAPDPYLTCILILGRADQDVNVYGWGHRTSGLEVQGWLTRAQHLVSGVCSRIPDEVDVS